MPEVASYAEFRSKQRLLSGLCRVTYISDKHKFQYFMIPKNASTMMAAIVLEEQLGRSVNDLTEIYARAGSPYSKHKCAWRSDYSPEPDKLRFIVYRDPVDRFLSAYNFMVKSPVACNTVTGAYVRQVCRRECSIDAFMEIVECECRAEYIHREFHVRPQADHFEQADVDWYVHMDVLPRFLSDKFGIQETRRINASLRALGEEQLSDGQKARVREIYAADLAYLAQVPDAKLYR